MPKQIRSTKEDLIEDDVAVLFSKILKQADFKQVSGKYFYEAPDRIVFYDSDNQYELKLTKVK